MYITILIFFLLISIILVFIIVIQEWKNSNIGSGYQSINSATLLISSEFYNTKTKITAIFATLFFLISLILGNLTSNNNITKSKWDNIDSNKIIKKNKSYYTNSNNKNIVKDIPH